MYDREGLVGKGRWGRGDGEGVMGKGRWGVFFALYKLLEASR